MKFFNRAVSLPLRWPAMLVLLSGFLLVAVILFTGLTSISAESAAADDTVSAAPLTGTHRFVGNQLCIECHADIAEEWQGSHHEQAMQAVNEKTVLGDFNDATFSDAGVTSRFFRKDGKYFINTPGEDGKAADFEVKYTFGVEPLQQYLLALPKGRLQAFTVAWDTEKKRWFDLHPDDPTPPATDVLHWSKRGFTANSSCIECHSTNMALNFDVEKREYHTSWSEPNVSCQSCHGPGSQHVDWAKAQTDKSNALSNNEMGLLINYRKMTGQGVVETCARCHSRRYAVSENDAHGRTFLDDFMPELLREGSYHADGQIKDEVYVYGSFVQSKMYHNGVSCNDCHNPHTLKLRKEGNALCMTCHQASPPKERFATLSVKNYNTPEHHFHPPDSGGAQCVSCHMPATTYMQVDPRRDHSFSVPRPDLTDKHGTPNACIRCHTDKPASWATAAMNEWYGESWQQRPNIATVLTPARQAAPEALNPLLALLKDPQQTDIIRATALDLLPQYGEAGFTASLDALKDASPLVRATALQGLQNIPTQQAFRAIKPLLNDPVRAVRIAAANLLISVPGEHFSQTELQQRDQALQEYKAAQLAMADHPEGHANLGNLAVRMGELQPAISAYQTAISLDPAFTPAYHSLGQLYYSNQQYEKAADTFRQALSVNPAEAEIHYSLALLLAEQKQLPAALTHLGKAAELLPQQAQVHYNYGLLLQKQKEFGKAEQALLHAFKLNSGSERTLQALIAFYQQQNQPDRAKAFVQQLVKLRAANPAGN
jgi:tetratricopeptide (TPR) repeat protein